MQIEKTNTELTAIVAESKLPAEKNAEVQGAYQQYLDGIAAVAAESRQINADEPTAEDEKLAHDLRMKLVKIRTGAEKTKDERKRGYLLMGNLEQACFNLISATCKPIEDSFYNIEKAREIAEKKRREQLRIDRISALSPYVADASIFPLGEMEQAAFDELLIGMKAQHQAKIEAEKKAEQDRIDAENAKKAEDERIRQENERLKAEREAIEKKAAEEARIAMEAKEKAEAELRAEREAAEAKLAEERQKAEAERKRLEDELRAKQEAELRAAEEAEAKRQEELSRDDKGNWEAMCSEIESACSKYNFKAKKFQERHKKLAAGIAEMLIFAK